MHEKLRNVEAEQEEQLKLCKEQASLELKQVTKRMRELEKRYQNEKARAESEIAQVQELREKIKDMKHAHKREIDATKQECELEMTRREEALLEVKQELSRSMYSDDKSACDQSQRGSAFLHESLMADAQLQDELGQRLQGDEVEPSYFDEPRGSQTSNAPQFYG